MGPDLLIYIVIAISVWIGQETVKGIKIVSHKAKCGVEVVIGKHC